MRSDNSRRSYPTGSVSKMGYLEAIMLLLIEKYLFYFFLFAIPFQTRKILWYEGWRFNEWTSISVYATDLLLAILLVFWAVNKFSISNPKSPVGDLGSPLRDFQFSINFQASILKKPESYLV